MRMILLALMLFSALQPRTALAAPIQPITMTAFLDKSTYQIGQPIVLEVDLHNSQTRKVSVRSGAYQKDWFEFTFLDAAGRIVPRTARGKKMLSDSMRDLYQIPPPVIFGPKATRRYRINLAALFLVSRANSYTLRVSSTLGFAPSGYSPSPITAGPFKFRILEAAAPRNAPATPFVKDPNASLNIP